MSKVAVTESSYKKAQSVFSSAEGLECFSAPEEEIALSEAIRTQGAKHTIVGVERYSGELYKALPRGGVLARFGVGHDNVDKALATDAGLLCTNTPGVLDDSVAEHTIALILAAARHIPLMSGQTKLGEWKVQLGSQLRGRTLAVIGCGRIGCRVASIASFGLGMRVVGCEVLDVNLVHFGFANVYPKFWQAAEDADFVSLHIPNLPQTRGYLNHLRIEQMAKKAWLINTARGAVVEEDALYDALAERRIAGAGLDVFVNEPYRPVTPGKDLRTLENVIMTPHVASSTQEASNAMAERALANIRAAEEADYERMDLLNDEVLAKLPRSGG